MKHMKVGDTISWNNETCLGKVVLREDDGYIVEMISPLKGITSWWPDESEFPYTVIEVLTPHQNPVE